MSGREKSSEQNKSSERQIIVQGFLFLLVLVPAIFVVCSIFLSNYVAQTPSVRAFDDAAKQAEIATCES
ncbi:hypothetical protein [Nostoc sp. PA-18-2419]|uniref:hypothetical protein n=1 Tax=Nostoc sp. PA-18-2419 TaxID=2575443 RepID=UPI0011096E1F|nr:hypothetical protein [Nostoc sp. PA-18-2419]